MANFYRSGNSAGRKTKGQEESSCPSGKVSCERLLGHFDASEFQRAAADSALHDDVVAGVGRDFVLRVNGVDLFVAFVHENIFRAMLLQKNGIEELLQALQNSGTDHGRLGLSNAPTRGMVVPTIATPTATAVNGLKLGNFGR